MRTERRYRSDDSDIDGCDNDLVIYPGENGDWYVSIVRRGERTGPHVRVTTSGTPPRLSRVCVEVARLFAALGGDDDEEYRAFQGGDDVIALRRELERQIDAKLDALAALCVLSPSGMLEDVREEAKAALQTRIDEAVHAALARR